MVDLAGRHLRRKVAFLRKQFPEPLATLYRIRNALRRGKYSAL